MKTIKVSLFISIIVFALSYVAVCQPKYHTIPNVGMKTTSPNGLYELPWHSHNPSAPDECNPFNETYWEEADSPEEKYLAVTNKYLGQKPVFAHQIVNDKDGNFLFFIVDNNIYNKNGYAFDVTIGEYGGKAELRNGYNQYLETAADNNHDLHMYHNIIVVPVPNSCNEFFIFYIMRHDESFSTENIVTPKLYYRKLTFNSDTDIDMTEEGQLYTDQEISGCDDGNSLSLSISDYDEGQENYLLVLHSSYDMYVFEINETVNTDYKKLYIGYADSTEETGSSTDDTGNEQCKRPDAVLFTKSDLCYYIFNSRLADNSDLEYNKINYAIFPRSFDQISTSNFSFNWTNYDTDYIIRGMECSPNKDYLYFTFYDAAGINYFDITNLTNNTGDIPATFSTISGSTAHNFNNTNIELFRDGKLYLIRHDNATTNTGTFTSINNPNSPSTTTITNNCFNGQTVRQINTINHDEKYKRYLFNHQMDDSDYSTNYPSICCEQPDWSTIGSNETWSPGVDNNPFRSETGVVYLDDDFEIPTGKYIQLSNMEFHFAAAKKAIINTGSTLRLVGTTLTSANHCDETVMWGGVQVNGNSALSQSAVNQGRFSMDAGSEISNAIKGVRVDGGGICQIYGGDFINNRYGIYLAAYTHPTVPVFNASTISNATFTTNAMLNNGQVPLYMVVQQNVKGVHITNCNFENTRGNDIAGNYRGMGVRALYSDFRASNCNITGLKYGSYITSGTPVVKTNNYTNNFRGAYFSGSTNVEITENTFDGDITYAPSTGLPYSVHVNGNGVSGTLYKFEDNTISDGTVGAYFNNLGAGAVQAKNNTFTSISGSGNACAAVAYGKNSDYIYGSGSSFGEEGLEFRCNTFTFNQYSLSVIDGNMRKYQGETGASSGSDYAGNSFDHFGINDERDFYVDASISSSLDIDHYTYYNHADEPYKVTEYTGKGDKDPKIIIGGIIEYYDGSDCSGSGGVVKTKSMSVGMTVAEGVAIVEGTDTEILLKEFELAEATDAGNTYDLLSQAETMTENNSTEVADNISVLDGYVSDEVAVTYMQNNNGNEFAKANALLQNSPLPVSVRGDIDEMEMNPALITIVEQQQLGVNPRDVKNAEIAGLKQYRALVVNEMYASAVKSESDVEKESLKTFLQNDDNLQSKFHLVNLHKKNNEISQSHTELENVKQIIQFMDIDYINEMETFIELKHLLIDVEANIISPQDVVADNLELVSYIANTESQMGQASAQNLLAEAGVCDFEEVVRLPEPLSQNKNALIENDRKIIPESFEDIINVYPNPAGETIYIEYAFFDNREKHFVEIYGINGNLIDKAELFLAIGIYTYSNNLPAGNYIIKVGENYSQKITIQ